jgi:hypothetical protein
MFMLFFLKNYLIFAFFAFKQNTAQGEMVKRL